MKKALQRAAGKFAIVGELFRFLWEQKLWWLIPMMTVFVLFGLLLVFTQGSALAPFIYTLF
ncbi:MAG: hypothetical protein HYY35_06925 [Deltaproteobacteria bacterium]|nr:hypothetical protein [Deltaproteobacteria bacterium]